MNINLIDNIWEIDNGEYYIGEGEATAYVVSDASGDTVYQNDDFECCLVWVYNSI